MIPPISFTDADLRRLDEFLSSDAVPESAMDFASLEGFLTALVIGPCPCGSGHKYKKCCGQAPTVH